MFSRIAKSLGVGGESAAIGADEQSIRDWLTQRLAKQLQMPASQIDPALRFDAYGLDSRTAVQLAGELEKVLERRLSPTLLFEYGSIDELARHLAEENGGPAAEVS